MNKQKLRKNYMKQLKFTYFIAAFAVLLSGVTIYTFFRNINNMFLFQFIQKPFFLDLLHKTVKTESLWLNMFIYNLPYGLWCLSGLLLIRSIWLSNEKWRAIYSGLFITIIMSYVILKLPGIIPGTFDVLDIFFMSLFAFVESITFYFFIKRRIY